jgi:sugar lactone lactonase YvrE
VVHIPASHPTSVAFGDQDLENLYVTTIGANLFGIEPKGELSGALLKIEGLGSRGVVSSRYRF